MNNSDLKKIADSCFNLLQELCDECEQERLYPVKIEKEIDETMDNLAIKVF